MSEFLDEHLELADWAEADLSRRGVSDVGRQGLTHESALRCGVLKQLRGDICRELAFALRDSATALRFTRLDGRQALGKSALQATVGSVSAGTWERINAALPEAACSEGLEDGSQVRVGTCQKFRLGAASGADCRASRPGCSRRCSPTTCCASHGCGQSPPDTAPPRPRIVRQGRFGANRGTPLPVAWKDGPQRRRKRECKSFLRRNSPCQRPGAPRRRPGSPRKPPSTDRN